MFSWETDTYKDDGKLLLLYRHERIIDNNLIKQGDRILDVGGWGKLSKRLQQEGCDVTLLNADPEECNRIIKRYGASFKVMNADIRSSGLEYNQYDVITCFETLEHILEDRSKAIEEIFKLLKVGGIFVGTIPIPGRCHPYDDLTVLFITPNDLYLELKKYSDNYKIEETGSVRKDDTPSSWFFYSFKRQF